MGERNKRKKERKQQRPRRHRRRKVNQEKKSFSLNPDLCSLSSSPKLTPADTTLVDDEKGFRVSTVGSPHVTGCATAREPGGKDGSGGGEAGAGSSRSDACSFALDLKGALRAVPSTKEGDSGEIDGAFHVARIVSDAEFEGGIGPLNVEVALDSGGDDGREKEEKSKGGNEEEKEKTSFLSSSDAAIERAKVEIARRIVEAVCSVVRVSWSPRKGKGGEEKKEEKKEEEEEEEVKVGGGEAA